MKKKKIQELVIDGETFVPKGTEPTTKEKIESALITAKLCNIYIEHVGIVEGYIQEYKYLGKITIQLTKL